MCLSFGLRKIFGLMLYIEEYKYRKAIVEEKGNEA